MSTKHKIGMSEIEKEFGVLTFGRMVRAHRLSEEMTQVEMAKKLKISKQNLNDIENERKIPSLKRAILISKKIGVTEALAVKLALQDQVRREKLNFTISIVPSNLKAS